MVVGVDVVLADGSGVSVVVTGGRVDVVTGVDGGRVPGLWPAAEQAVAINPTMTRCVKYLMQCQRTRRVRGLLLRFEPCSAPMQIGIDELVEIPVEYRLDVPDLDSGAEIFDHLIGLEYV